jgi:hypothetical protein
MKKGSSKFDPAMRERILARISRGDRLLRICAEPGMPSVFVINKWLRHSSEFRQEMEEAKALGQARKNEG